MESLNAGGDKEESVKPEETPKPTLKERVDNFEQKEKAKNIFEQAAQKYGIERGVPMPIGLADSKHANPKFRTLVDGSFRPYTSNCQTCVVAYEHSNDDVDKVIEAISKHYKVVRVKYQTPDKFAGYSGNIVNVELPNGEIGEMQVNTPQMIFGKEVERDARMILGDGLWERLKANAGNLILGLGHRMYEVLRDDSIDDERLDIVERNSRIYYDRIRKISL